MHEKAYQIIVDNSKNKQYPLHEWFLYSVEDTYSDDAKCECGHHIRYKYIIINKYTKKKLTFGSVCVKMVTTHAEKFIRLKEMLDGTRLTCPKSDALYYFNCYLINKWEYRFLLNCGQKRVLSRKQNEFKMKILNNINCEFEKLPLQR